MGWLGGYEGEKIIKKNQTVIQGLTTGERYIFKIKLKHNYLRREPPEVIETDEILIGLPPSPLGWQGRDGRGKIDANQTMIKFSWNPPKGGLKPVSYATEIY